MPVDYSGLSARTPSSTAPAGSRDTSRKRESRPVGGNGPAQRVSAAASTTSNLTALDDIARHVDGTFVVVVQVTGGKYRRRCYLTAASAERAAARALDRGESATVYLAELKPLWKLGLAGGAR